MVNHLRAVVLLLSLLPLSSEGADKVLLINSYHPQYEWTAALTRGVQDTLASSIPAENLFIEYMDERRFLDDPIYHKKLIALLSYKFSLNPPDLVITSDDPAFQFMLEYGEQLFPNTPIVFSGVNVFEPQSIADKPNFTGIAEGMDIEGNLALITQMQPEVNRIILLGDTTGLGLRMINQGKKIADKWQNIHPSLAIEFLDSFAMQELYKLVANLDKKTAILMLAIHKDRDGQYFSFQEHLPILSKKSNVPIYGMWGGLMINYGAIGGMMNDPYEHGANTAKMAARLLSGETIKQLPPKLSAKYSPRFDYQQIMRFGLDERFIPVNSALFNKPVSFYQQHKRLINFVIGLICLLIIIITLMFRNILQRRHIQKQLNLFNIKLEETVKARTAELEKANQSMKMLAHTDSLTGLKNRRAANKDIPNYLQRHNYSDQPFTLLILDIDHFKKINDNYGHNVGDEVLQAVANALSSSLRPNDRVYRWGGEEFIMALPDTSAEDAKTVCRRLADNLRNIQMGELSNITASIGLSARIAEDDFESIVHRADNALYLAKDNGRDQYIIA